jgi:hypothetical protein
VTSSIDRPAIRLLYARDASAELVRSFEHGCEEESVPVVTAVANVVDAVSLARTAASESSLFIGAGIDAEGRIALHEHRLADRAPLLIRDTTTPEIARGFGGAAGRLARGRPIPDVVAGGNL